MKRLDKFFFGGSKSSKRHSAGDELEQSTSETLPSTTDRRNSTLDRRRHSANDGLILRERRSSLTSDSGGSLQGEELTDEELLNSETGIEARSSLKYVLEHPELRVHFKKFCLVRHCSENVLFYLKASAFHKACAKGNAGGFAEDHVRVAKQIRSVHIEDNSPMQVNLDHKIKQRILAHIDNGEYPPDLFDGACKQVLNLMISHIFPDFKRSAELLDGLRQVETKSKRIRLSSAVARTMSTSYDDLLSISEASKSPNIHRRTMGTFLQAQMSEDGDIDQLSSRVSQVVVMRNTSPSPDCSPAGTRRRSVGTPGASRRTSEFLPSK
eukprot:Colp12_sorted_trinity150504_noHs@18860